MKKVETTIILLCVLCVSLFKHIYDYRHPKIIIKTEIEEHKVYDLSQSPEIIEAYANAQGKTLKDLKEYEARRDNVIAEINQQVLKKQEAQKDFEIEKLKWELEFLKSKAKTK